MVEITIKLMITLQRYISIALRNHYQFKAVAGASIRIQDKMQDPTIQYKT